LHFLNEKNGIQSIKQDEMHENGFFLIIGQSSFKWSSVIYNVSSFNSLIASYLFSLDYKVAFSGAGEIFSRKISVPWD